MTSPMAVKFVDGSDDVIEGLILPFGGVLNGQDLTGSHFTKDTEFCLDWFAGGAGRPGLYAHGFDPALKASVVGREVKNWADDKGRWMQAQLDKRHEYFAEIKELVDRGALSFSSGAVDHLVEIAQKSGAIKMWPWVEWSLVPNPAHPGAAVYSLKSAEAVEHLAVIGIEIPDAIKEAPAAEPEPAPAAKAIETFADIQAAAVLDQELPAALDTLRSALYGAIYAWTEDGPADPEAKESAIAKTLDEFRAYLIGVLDRAGKSAPAIPPATRAAPEALPQLQSIHDATTSLGATCGEGSVRSADDTPPAPVLAIRAGDEAAPVSDDELARIRDLLGGKATTEATEAIRSYLGRD